MSRPHQVFFTPANALFCLRLGRIDFLKKKTINLKQRFKKQVSNLFCHIVRVNGCFVSVAADKLKRVPNPKGSHPPYGF